MIPKKNIDEISDEFIFDTHHDLIKIAPELLPQFETLFKTLEDKMKKNKK